MKKYFIVEDATGDILEHGTIETELDAVNSEAGQSVIEDTWGSTGADTHYWDGSQPQLMDRLEDTISQDRADIDIAGDTPVVFTLIPANTTVTGYEKAAGVSETIWDGELTYNSDIAGEHYLVFTHPTHIRWEISVTAA